MRLQVGTLGIAKVKVVQLNLKGSAICHDENKLKKMQLVAGWYT